MRAARSARRSIAIARIVGSASIHSIATEPAPPPMSHNNSPRRGASADNVTARTSRLVIWPSCSKSSSARPGARAMTRASGPAATSIASVLSGSTAPQSNAPAVVARIRSRGPPSASSTVTREAPKPTLRAAAPKPPAHRRRRSMPECAAGCRCGRTRSRCGHAPKASPSAQRPAEPRRGQTEGRRGRHDDHLARIDLRASTVPTP